MAFMPAFGRVFQPPFATAGAAVAVPCYYLTFDGLNDLITLAGIVLTPPFTIVAWTRRRVTGVTHPIVANAADAPYFQLRRTNMIRLNHKTNTYSNASLTTAWSHVSVTAPAAANAAVFRDGVDVSIVAAVAAAALPYNRIGMSGALLFDGELAAIGIAPAALNIPALWAAGTLHRPLDPLTFTTACWNMRNEGGAGVTLDDESASGNDGTFLGAGEPLWAGTMAAGGPAGWTD